ncbi:MAG: 16S rRNA (cytosine(1402)-N(4))-methyltransferase RsmH [Fimbriimonadales bacterium]
MRRHRPAMLLEVMELLAIQGGATIVDGTVGHGGHAEQMLEAAGETGELIAFDWDMEMLKIAENNLTRTSGRKTFVNADYREIPAWLARERKSADAILLDFGVNLQHFEDTARGFSFAGEAPLDMRMDRSTKETAAAWLNRASEGEIARALREFGGEKWARPIARQVCLLRKGRGLKMTDDLVQAVLRAVPASKREQRLHPATRTFQAVRIAINQELDDLEDTVVQIACLLKPAGRMVTLAYHSGEDAAAKNAFRKLAANGEHSVLTKKPLRPSESEVSDNPNARSARLRAIGRAEEETK